MLETGYESSNDKYIYKELHCGCCKEYLGKYEHFLETGEIQNDIERWSFCPYCGELLDT